MVFTLALVMVTSARADAIVNGTLDGSTHPEVGALIAEFRAAGQKDVLGSGTLIAPQVFLTAGHCTSFLAANGITRVWVTFDSTFTASSLLIQGTYVTNPDVGFSGPGGSSDAHDQAVVLLDSAAAGITPARLPTANLLDRVSLAGQTFTAVGYGTVRTDKTGGPHFLGGLSSNLEVSLTVTGDAVCRATDKTYRLDTPAARAFLGQFVTLP